MEQSTILYRDEHLVAVNKPAGLLVHPTAIDRHEKATAMQALRDHLGCWIYPFHRIDKATSGVLVFALDRETARRMTCFFSEGTVSKSYLAVVRGYTKESDRIDYPLKEERSRMEVRTTEKYGPGKPAVTGYRRLAVIELPVAVDRYATARYSLVEAFPVTGRTHQIRRHMKHIFHPVVGDTTYGDGKQNLFFRTHFNCRRLLLHARSVRFSHPWSGLGISIEAPLDQTFCSLLQTLGWTEAAGSPG